MSFAVGASASDSFDTNAKFSVDNKTLSLSSAVATIERYPFTQGYFWIRIDFYSFPPSADDMATINNGSVTSMEKKWMSLANNVNAYNTSHATIQLTVDKNFKVGQVDMSIPGHFCTIASSELDVRKFAENYKFDGKNIKLKSKGTYLCDLSRLKTKNEKFDWDINLETRVFEKK
jgi:hypothetical protein